MICFSVILIRFVFHFNPCLHCTDTYLYKCNLHTEPDSDMYRPISDTTYVCFNMKVCFQSCNPAQVNGAHALCFQVKVLM